MTTRLFSLRFPPRCVSAALWRQWRSPFLVRTGIRQQPKTEEKILGVFIQLMPYNFAKVFLARALSVSVYSFIGSTPPSTADPRADAHTDSSHCRSHQRAVARMPAQRAAASLPSTPLAREIPFCVRFLPFFARISRRLRAVARPSLSSL